MYDDDVVDVGGGGAAHSEKGVAAAAAFRSARRAATRKAQENASMGEPGAVSRAGMTPGRQKVVVKTVFSPQQSAGALPPSSTSVVGSGMVMSDNPLSDRLALAHQRSTV